MMRFSFFFLLFTLFVCTTPILAQEADPYDEYSYLWPDKDKKKKKRKKTDTQIPLVISDTIPPIDTLQIDSLESEAFPQDSTLSEPQTIVPDSTQSIEDFYDDPFGVGDTEEKAKNEKQEATPIEDFRTPFSSPVGGGSFTGGFTYTQIGNEDFVGLVLSPEFAIGKVGVGLNIPILYGLDSREIRTEIFEDGVGVARLIRYIRYGRQKQDPVYVKVGELQGLMLGYGGLVNNYTNTTSFEKRKVGLHFDVNYQGIAGIEGMYSDFDPASQNLLGIRPYVRPLSKTSIPIARTLEFGATFVSDRDQTEITPTDTLENRYIFTESGVTAFGLDIGVTVFRSPFVQIDLFANYSKLNVLSDTLRSVGALLTGETNIKEGSGVSAGVNFRMHFIANVFSTDVRIERLNYTNNYLPQFFNAAYELNKDARILSLVTAEKTSGIYGSLEGHVLQKVELGGSLLIPDNISDSSPAFVEVHANLERLADKFTMNASYLKTGLSDLGDAFSFDERSLAKVRFIYHMNKFLATGVEYYYYWEPAPSGNLEVTRYVMPYFGVSIDF